MPDANDLAIAELRLTAEILEKLQVWSDTNQLANVDLRIERYAKYYKKAFSLIHARFD